MNLNDNPTVEQFRDLLRQHDDRAGHHVLWVRRDGEVMLTCLPRSNPRKPPTYEHPQMQMRYDTFPVGYGFVGPESLEDAWFMGEVFKHLLEQWGKLKGVPGMTHLDLNKVAPYGRPVDAEEAAEIRREREEFARRKQSGEIGRCPADTGAKHGSQSRMNLNDNPTLEQFHDLLRQHDDRAGHHVLWVRKDGEVMLTCLPKSNPRRPPTYEHPQMQMRYDTFPVGKGYVGQPPPEEDDGWFKGELFKHMLQQWARLKGAAGVTHLDLDSVAPDGCPVDAEEAAELRRLKEEFAQRKRSGQSGCCPSSG